MGIITSVPKGESPPESCGPNRKRDKERAKAVYEDEQGDTENVEVDLTDAEVAAMKAELEQESTPTEEA